MSYRIFALIGFIHAGLALGASTLSYKEAKALFDSGTALKAETVPGVGKIETTVISEADPVQQWPVLFVRVENAKGEMEVRSFAPGPELTAEEAATHFLASFAYIPPATFDKATNSLSAWSLYISYRLKWITDKGEEAFMGPQVARWRVAKDKSGKDVIVCRIDVHETGYLWKGKKAAPFKVEGAMYLVADSTEFQPVIPDSKVVPSAKAFFGSNEVATVQKLPAPAPVAVSPGGHWEWQYHDGWRGRPGEKPLNWNLSGALPGVRRVWVKD